MDKYNVVDLNVEGSIENDFNGAIIIDDAIKPEDADQDTIRERVNSRWYGLANGASDFKLLAITFSISLGFMHSKGSSDNSTKQPIITEDAEFEVIQPKQISNG